MNTMTQATMTARDYGRIRGRQTGRAEPEEADYYWLHHESEGEFKRQTGPTWGSLLSVEDRGEFAIGMFYGAREPQERTVLVTG